MGQKKVFFGLAAFGLLITSMLLFRVAWSVGNPTDLLPFGIGSSIAYAQQDITQEEGISSSQEIEDLLNEGPPKDPADLLRLLALPDPLLLPLALLGPILLLAPILLPVPVLTRAIRTERS